VKERRPGEDDPWPLRRAAAQLSETREERAPDAEAASVPEATQVVAQPVVEAEAEAEAPLAE